ncbi:hypothetical protein [Companilactobacillus musae]|uniref:hypothetical protein n=1 Tax=Companilactobacillus musae TaxID=1903258 RepID=UPI0013C30516|nr:hypothetical protein [Companilactobacillus musae]
MMKLINHWYWGRANIDDYTVISGYITAEKEYDHMNFPIFMVAKGDKILVDNPKYLKFEEKDAFIEPKTGKPVPKVMIYDYNDGKNHIKATYLHEKTILNSQMIEILPPIKRIAAKLSGFDGAYLRFSGAVKPEVFNQDGTIAKTHTNNAIWEEIYFGKTIK